MKRSKRHSAASGRETAAHAAGATRHRGDRWLLRDRNPAAAIKVRDEIKEVLRVIGDHPQIGRDLGGYLRRLPLPRSPYLVFYRFGDASGRPVIVTIRHAARTPEGAR